jgi:hypothetical protein
MIVADVRMTNSVVNVVTAVATLVTAITALCALLAVLFTLVTIAGTLLLGTLLGALMKIDRKTTHLISSGTAICGGSAIAAVAPVIKADDKQISVDEQARIDQITELIPVQANAP